MKNKIVVHSIDNTEIANLIINCHARIEYTVSVERSNSAHYVAMTMFFNDDEGLVDKMMMLLKDSIKSDYTLYKEVTIIEWQEVYHDEKRKR